jgi:hypothetical protein
LIGSGTSGVPTGRRKKSRKKYEIFMVLAKSRRDIMKSIFHNVV